MSRRATVGPPPPAPILVARVDLDRPLPDLSPERADGGRYSHTLVHWFHAGRPVGKREIEFGAAPLTAAELARYAPTPPFPAPPAAPEQPPFVSVVVPTVMARPTLLERSIAALAALEYPAYEVIVVDNRPEDTPVRAALHERLRAYPRVIVLTEAYPGISAARNRGLAQARGEIVACTDDDAVVDPGWLAAIAARLAAEPDTDAVTGLVLPAELETAPQIWFEYSGSKISDDFQPVSYRRTVARPGRFSTARYAVSALHAGRPEARIPVYRAKFGMGANMAFRTAALRRLGGFDEALGTGTGSRGGEDIVALSRLLYSGGAVTFDPAVLVHHHHRRDEAGLLSQLDGYGVGYTAALTALVRSDPWHLVGLAQLAGTALGVLRHNAAQHSRVRYPARFNRVQRRGLLAGPWRYLRARRALRRADRPAHTATAAAPLGAAQHST